jgi:hypothetical protein
MHTSVQIRQKTTAYYLTSNTFWFKVTQNSIKEVDTHIFHFSLNG